MVSLAYRLSRFAHAAHGACDDSTPESTQMQGFGSSKHGFTPAFTQPQALQKCRACIMSPLLKSTRVIWSQASLCPWFMSVLCHRITWAAI